MTDSDSELAARVRRRAQRTMLAALEALNGLPAPQRKLVSKLPLETVHRALSVAVLRVVVFGLGRARGLFRDDSQFARGRLFVAEHPLLDVQARVIDGEVRWLFPDALIQARSAFAAELEVGLKSDGIDFAECPAELVGTLYEVLLGQSLERTSQGELSLSSNARRKQTGTFFTPRALTQEVVDRALQALERRIRASSHRSHDFVLEFRACDPAVGGGAFLVQLGRALATRAGAESKASRRRAIASHVLYGVDVNPTALAVAEAALCLFVSDETLPLSEAGPHLRVGDALIGPPVPEPARGGHAALLARSGFDFVADFPEVFAHGGFDLVIGNPPWVAYAGRAAQPLDPRRKLYFSTHYTTLKGYPTLQGLFVERALRLAPQGTVALVVPSPIADLQGYRAVRRAVRATHTPCEPLLEFGQDAFESVTQPCFALIADARTGNERSDAVADAPFRLSERQRAGGVAAELAAPEKLAQLAHLSAFPRTLFGEMGFQTSRRVTQELLLRTSSPTPRHHYPLLEGRDVRAFWQGAPRLYLAPDATVLAESHCRLRDRDDYARVRFVVRQTARYPIAALHAGLPFRNSLLAGFAVEGFSPELMVGLLNSSLYRALHLATQRDARQATFPQVKIGHLRGLPAPPEDPEGRARVAALSAESSRAGADAALNAQLDAAVFALFSVESSAISEIHEFLKARSSTRG